MSLLADERLPRVVLLDIEGTTTPAEFVYQTLFPYARNHLREFLERHQHDAEVMNDLKDLEAERNADAVRGLHPPEWRGGSSESNLSSAAFYAQWLMDRDRKSTALKSLQGKIWQAGYGSGELKGQVYSDVPPALARWQALNRRVCIFSSEAFSPRNCSSHTPQSVISHRLSAPILTPPREQRPKPIVIGKLLLPSRWGRKRLCFFLTSRPSSTRHKRPDCNWCCVCATPAAPWPTGIV